ncbi:Thioredoxin domain-containing protein 3 [Sciurus carolinensis]|uniref:Thioredoxin domain-containing protein 3 n=1 Tax=Sciurus carolinensis TaxID=30640 RepID=A0AA41T9S9_SCICA|nr:Thioredoxin domain-containing protein 3 [Sciurus carolinensis]
MTATTLVSYPKRGKGEPAEHENRNQNGKIIAKIEGANAPLINRKVTNLIDEEKKIVAGEMVRPQYDEILLKDLDSEEAGEGHDGNVEHYCITIIKPDAVISKKVLEIKEKVSAIWKIYLVQVIIELFYFYHFILQPDFEEFVSFMTTNLSYVLVVSPGIEKTDSLGEIQALETEPDESPEDLSEAEVNDTSEVTEKNRDSGPSLALVLLRENGLQYWKNLLGPTNVNEASEFYPDSLCAQFAMGRLPVNQLYGSDSKEIAEREIQYFFPPQNTLAVIKPHVTHEQREEIMKIIKDAGFELTQLKEMVLNQEEANKIYYKIATRDFYKDVLAVLAEGPSLVMVLTKWNAIGDWRRLMGPVDPEEARLLSPESIRAKYGINILKNAVHGASNTSEAAESISKMFRESVSEDSEEN